MIRKTNKKQAFLMSVLSLVLCVSMLMGTTFAWFTDTVTSANNIIKAGNLDIELWYQTADMSADAWEEVTAASNIFKDGALWEPGYTEVVKLKIVNKGTLALKYQLGINVAGEIPGTNVAGEEFKLSKYIEFGVTDVAVTDRAAAIDAVSATARKISEGYSVENVEMLPAAEQIITLVVFMPTTVGNEANYKTGTTAPTINLGLNLIATQLNADTEKDSFGSDYDKDATYPIVQSAVLPENRTEDTPIKANEKVAVSVPASAPAGNYTLNVSNKNVSTDDNGETTLSLDISLERDGVKVNDGNVYTISIEVGQSLIINEVLHNGAAVPQSAYTYRGDTGILEIKTRSFSPFGVVYLEGYDYVADGVTMKDDNYYISNRAGYNWMDAREDNFFKNKTIYLTTDIDFGGDTITGIKFWNSHPVFDGQGHTLSNFVIEHSGSKSPSGLFYGTFDVKNLVVDKATVTGDYAGGISGWIYGNIDGCTVKNSTIASTYWQAGGLAGQYNSGNVTNSTVEDCVISGGSAVGGLLGILNETAGERKVENCTVKNCEVVQNGGFGGVYDTFFGAAVGLINIEESTVYFNNCTITGTTVKGVASDTLYGVAEESTIVLINGGLTVTTNDELKAAIEAKVSKIYLQNGDYSVRFTNNTNFNVDNMTIVGLGDAVKLSVSSSEVSYGRVQGDNVTFENIVFVGSVGATGMATYNNCTVTGNMECASSNKAKTYVNNCTIELFHTSVDYSSDNAYVKGSKIAKAEYSGSADLTIYFENCEIGELISWNVNTELTNCKVTTLDESRMTSGKITVK